MKSNQDIAHGLSESQEVPRLSRSFLGDDKILGCVSVPQRALLRTLGTSLERQLDTAALVANLAADFPGMPGQRLTQLSQRLLMRVPLAEAIRQTPGILDPSVVVALEFAEQEGRMGELCHELVESSMRWDHATPTSLDGGFHQLMRSGAALLITVLIISFLMIFIVPTFDVFFSELGLTTPPLFQSLLALSSIIPLVLVGMTIVAVGMITFNSITEIKGFSDRFDPLAWQRTWIPNRTKLLALLSLIVGSNRPIGTSLAAIGQSHSDPQVRNRLLAASRRMGEGQETFEALRAAKLISAGEQNSLTLTDSSRARAWMLRQFASRRWDRTRLRRAWVARTVSILSTCFLGFIVAWTSVAAILTLSELVRALQ